MFPIGSPPRKVLIALYNLAIDQGFTGYGAGPAAAQHWEFMESRTGLSRAEIGLTLTGLHAHGLVSAPRKTADHGAYLGEAFISDDGIALVQTWSVPPDPVPVAIASISPDAIAALETLVAMSKALNVPDSDIDALTHAIEKLAAAKDEPDRLARMADVATVILASEGLTRTLFTAVLPTLGQLLG